MSGMGGQSFDVKMEDLALSWKQLKSSEQKIRQFKILGYWAIVNFPLLCRKLFGKTHQLPPRNGLSVVGNTENYVENIDELVFSKMKLRVIELRVSQSTQEKLNHFVSVPSIVGATRSNEINISKKLVSFDVDEDFVETCWDALRCGEFPPSSDAEHTMMYPFVTAMIKDISDDQSDKSENERTTSNSKRLCRRGSERVLIVPNNEEGSNNDSLRAIVLGLRDGISTLSESIQGRKDDEVVKITASANELKRTNKDLVANQVDLEKKIEIQASLVIALEKGIDANISLNEKYKSEMAACILSNEELKIEMQRLNTKSSEAVASKQKLENEFASFKVNSDSVVSELRMKIEANTKLKVDLAACLESNKQLKIEVELKDRKLIEAENEIVSNKAELQQLNDVNINLKEQFQRDLASCLQSGELQKREVERLGERLFEANKTIASNVNMKSELSHLKSKGESIIAELRSEIQCLIQFNSEKGRENEHLKLELKKYAEREKSDVVTQTGESEMGGGSNDLFSGEDASSTKHVSADPKVLQSNSDSEFQSVDTLVESCRKSLHGLEFAWIKFPNFKNDKYTPGFVHPPDKNGKRAAQWILVSGCLSSKKKEFSEFVENLSDDQKDSTEKSALQKFNTFSFNYK